MMDLPVACSLGPDALAARREGLLSKLFQSVRSHEPLANGHRFSLAATAETLDLIMRTVAAERLCCRFLRFEVVVEPDEGPVTLELTGPPGTRDFLSALFEE
jgi:hypothetical protein